MKKPPRKRTPPTTTKVSAKKPMIQKDPGYKRSLMSIVQYGCLAGILLFVMYVRYRLLELPLERDEGEYALMGQLILKGIPPYEMAYNMKLPGTYYMYALLMSVFGQNTTGIHFGLLIVNLTSIVLLFFISKKLINQTAALFIAISFSLLSISPGTYGFAAHATHFNVLFALTGILILLHYAERPTRAFLILSGFSFGLSFIMKQQAVFFMPFGFLAMWLFERKRVPFQLNKTALRLVGFGAAMLLPYVLVLLVAWYSGTLEKFWHWTVEYARQYVGMNTMSKAWHTLSLNFFYLSIGFRLFWIMGLVGLMVMFFSVAVRKNRWLILAFVFCSCLCVIPGFYFRSHYFIIFLPALAMLIGIALNFSMELLSKGQWPRLSFLPVLFFGFMIYEGIHSHSSAFFKEAPADMCKRIYGSGNPFQESMEIAKFISANSNEQDKIAILGSEPQIYFYSNRLPATGYIYTYSLMENQPYSRDMQLDMIAEIEKNQPKFLLMVSSSMSWLRSKNSANDIFDWYSTYKQNYNLVGLVDLNPNGPSTFLWRDAVNNYQPKSDSNIWVYERK